jgi:hypothetical protein
MVAIISLEKETTRHHNTYLLGPVPYRTGLYLQKVGEHGSRTEHTHLNSGAHLFIPFKFKNIFYF